MLCTVEIDFEVGTGFEVDTIFEVMTGFEVATELEVTKGSEAETDFELEGLRVTVENVLGIVVVSSPQLFP